MLCTMAVKEYTTLEAGAATVKRLLGWPLRRALDPRVRMTVHEIDARLGSEDRGRPTIHDRLDDLDRMGRDMLAGLGWREAPQPGGELRALDAPRAAYLNWAGGPDGYAAQAGLWFNPPVPVHHTAGGVEVLLVNERIVEQPFVFGAIARAFGDRAARILDVGGSESTVGLSLATLGHAVTIVDPRAQPLRHRNLTHAACRLDELPVGGEPFDAAVVLSAVEHFGLEHYDLAPSRDESSADGTTARPRDALPAAGERLDLAALQGLRELVRPGGLLVLTVPFAAQPSVDHFQRVYDEDGLAELLRGWSIQTSLRWGRVDRLTWELGVPSREGHGVALVTALRPS
jgi:hypothetical protein